LSIYLDNAATTKPLELLADGFRDYAENGWYNPSALYSPAADAQEKLREARLGLCGVINAPEMVFNSCGTEGANTAILRGYRPRGNRALHFITSAYEHPAVFEAMRFLQTQGHQVTFIRPRGDGLIYPADVAAAVRPDTALVSIMHVNNEIGAVNDVTAIAAAVKRANPAALFHSDGVQAFLRIPINFGTSKIDYYTVSAHKVHALKGTGALFYKSNAPLKAYVMGGGQEKGLRSGTENTFGILFFAQATGHYMEHQVEYLENMWGCRETLVDRLSQVAGTYIIEPSAAAPHILAVCFADVHGETLLHMLEQKGIYVNTGSACSSKKRDNRVLSSIGVDDRLAQGMLRLSLCPFNTPEQMEHAANEIAASVEELRRYVRR